MNSPVMFRKRLWKETRVAVFQHSIDTRHETARSRGLAPRVDLGEKWVDDSVLELIREDIAKYRVLLSKGVEEDSLDALDQGKIPGLDALCLHNGTVQWSSAFCDIPLPVMCGEIPRGAQWCASDGGCWAHEQQSCWRTYSR